MDCHEKRPDVLDDCSLATLVMMFVGFRVHRDIQNTTNFESTIHDDRLLQTRPIDWMHCYYEAISSTRGTRVGLISLLRFF